MLSGRIIGTSGILLFLFLAMGQAQIFDDASGIFDESSRIKYDTNYIEVYRDELTTRAYILRKQNGYTLSDRLLSPGIKYRTNDNVRLGLGFTYSFLTLNLALKIPFINQDNELYGKTKYLDLRTQGMFRSYMVDLYLQWNKGYYMANPDQLYNSWQSGQSLPIRGDLRTSIVGLNVQYLFNSHRYSYKASFLQNEFQRRSAGSPIIGIEAYWMLAMADSLIIPEQVPELAYLDTEAFNQMDMANVGLNGGYAYTFVWEEKLYLSLSTTLGISAAYNQLYHTTSSTSPDAGISVGINNLNRISLGFNSPKYYVGLSYVRFSMSNLVGTPGDWVTYSTGNIRFHIVKRFRLKRPITILRPDLWNF
jgi:hypothetical protein